MDNKQPVTDKIRQNEHFQALTELFPEVSWLDVSNWGLSGRTEVHPDRSWFVAIYIQDGGVNWRIQSRGGVETRGQIKGPVGSTEEVRSLFHQAARAARSAWLKLVQQIKVNRLREQWNTGIPPYKDVLYACSTESNHGILGWNRTSDAWEITWMYPPFIHKFTDPEHEAQLKTDLESEGETYTGPHDPFLPEDLLWIPLPRRP